MPTMKASSDFSFSFPQFEYIGSGKEENRDAEEKIHQKNVSK
jgi:hypothetical protein